MHGESHRNLLKVQCFCLISVSANRSLPIALFFSSLFLHPIKAASLQNGRKRQRERERDILFTLSPVEEEGEDGEKKQVAKQADQLVTKKKTLCAHSDVYMADMYDCAVQMVKYSQVKGL